MGKGYRMGIDCYLFDEKNYHSLDRWYVFSDFFESEKGYSKVKLLRELDNLQKEISTTSDEEWWEIYLSSREYYERWIKKAQEIVKQSKSDRFIFFLDSDMPGEFYERIIEKVFRWGE